MSRKKKPVGVDGKPALDAETYLHQFPHHEKYDGEGEPIIPYWENGGQSPAPGQAIDIRKMMSAPPTTSELADNRDQIVDPKPKEGKVTTMRTLKEQLAEVESKYPNSRFAQMLRNQVAAEERGQSARDLYVTGSVKRLPGKRVKKDK